MEISDFKIWVSLPFIVIIVLGLIQRFFWLFNKYFPFNRDSCQWGCDNRSRWWRKAGELFHHLPQGASVVGFLCALLWPFLIALNVLILAQVLEMVFPGGGRRIPLPWVGTYSVFPLIMGFLWAITQTVFGVIFKAIRAETFWTKLAKICLFILIALSIVCEAGLAIWRAYLLNAGEIPISPTQVDIIISKYGPWLAGIIGLFVPIGEILAGTFGFGQFIEPMVKVGLYWFGGLMVSVWGIGVWWVCVSPKPVIIHQREKVPQAVTDLKNETNELEKKVEKLKKDTNELKTEITSNEILGKKIQSFDEPIQKIGQFENKIKQWDARIDNIDKGIEEANDWRSLKQVKKTVKKANKEIDDQNKEIERFLPEVVQFVSLKTWEDTVNRFKNDFGPKLVDAETDLLKLDSSPLHIDLKNIAQEISNILLGVQTPSSVIPHHQRRDLESLLEETKASDRKIKESAENILDTSHRITNNVRSNKLLGIETDLENLSKTLKELREKFNQYTPAIATAPYKAVEDRTRKVKETVNHHRKTLKGLLWKYNLKYLSLLLPWNWGKR
ncbi:MAG: hypothetical protein AB1422_07845 [bacterium]